MTMAKSNVRRNRGKASADRPSKPYEEFPLVAHPSGHWCKKIRGKLRYCGRWGRIVDGKMQRIKDDGWEAALAKYKRNSEAWYAGRTPRDTDGGLTVKELCNRFMNAKRIVLETGEITKRTHDDYLGTCARVIGVFGADRLVDDLASEDFELLRENISKTRGTVSLTNEITRVRSCFKYAYESNLIDKPMRYGTTFKRPSKKVLRRPRADNGPRMFEPSEILAMLDEASAQIHAMVLLAINCGFGNSDCGSLPLTAIDLKGGWIDFPRPKTGVARRCPLWLETRAAIKDVIAERPDPRDEANANLAFITKYGQPWAKDDQDNPITKETRKLLDNINVFDCKCGTQSLKAVEDLKCPKCKKAKRKPDKRGIYRPGLGFYALRHTFRTIADDTRDFPAIDHIMGHARDDMASVYRERIDDERLRAVVDHVYDWLFATK